MEELFKALSEPTRLRMLSLLMHGEMCVCEIESSLKLTQSNASRHLTSLKRCGILENYKQAQWTYYRIGSVFKTEHEDLWNYLSVKLKSLPTYKADFTAYQTCKASGICCNQNKPH